VSGECILVVDDNPANVKLVKFILAKRGYDVRVAVDANEALAALKAVRPALILMDLQLPGMDGLELTRRIRADPATSGIAIVAVTAFAMTGDEQRARQAGCDGYVTKPIDTHTFPSLVSHYLTTALAGRGDTGP
jgi:CheY-like chemotaxis protein